MAKRGRKCGPLGGMKRVASNMQRKATNSATSLTYELLWGEKPKKKRKTKTEN